MPTNPPTIGTVERMLSLNRLPVLSGLAPEDLAVVAEHARERFLPTGTVLLREGEPIPALYAVLDGKILISRRGRTLGRVSPGGFVGAAGMFARDPEGLSAVAQTDTLVLEVEADAVLEICEDHFPIFHHVLREMCRLLIDLVGRLPPGLHGSIFPNLAPPRAPTGDLDLVERILFLRQVAPFLHASINALAELSRQLAQVRFAPGITLWREGEPAPGAYLILSGTVHAVSEKHGLDFRAGSGVPLGAIEAGAEVPRFYDAVTETEVVALQGTQEALLDVFEDNFVMAADFLAAVSTYLQMILNRKIAAGQSTLGVPRDVSALGAVPVGA